MSESPTETVNFDNVLTYEEAPSPFLEGTNIQFAWDSTSLGWLKTCPRLYYYHMIEGWVGKSDNIHLRFGIEFHQALQDYDISRAAGITHDDAVHDVVRALIERIHDWEPEPHKASEELKSKPNLIRTIVWYLEEHRNDPAKTIILTNGQPAVEVSFRFELDFSPGETAQPYLLCGHLDRVVDFAGETYVMDRKTATQTPGSYYFDQFNPNNQMTLYTIASGVIFDVPLKGVVIDAAQIAVGFSRFVRGITYRSPDILQEWMEDLRYWLTLAESFANAGRWPMNDTACGSYGGCRFRGICSKSPHVRGSFLKSKFVKGERWNPLKPR